MNKISNIGKTRHDTLMMISNCAIYGKKKSIFIKNQETSGLLSNLGMRNL